MPPSDTFNKADVWVQKGIVYYAVNISAMTTENLIRKTMQIYL